MNESFADEPLFHDVKVENLSWGRDLSGIPSKHIQLQQEEGDEEEDEEINNEESSNEIIFENVIQNNINLDHIPSKSQKNRLSPVQNRQLSPIQNHIDPQKDPRGFNYDLIKSVEQHPALFDTNNEGYKLIEVRNRQWDEIATGLGQPVEFVRTRWKTMRDRFKKEYRKHQNNVAIIWPHFNDMLYILPFVRDRPCADESQNQNESVNGTDHLSQNANSSLLMSNCHNSNNKKQQQQQQNYNPTNLILDFAMNAVNEKEMTFGANSPCSSTESEPKKPLIMANQQQQQQQGFSRNIKKSPNNNRKLPTTSNPQNNNSGPSATATVLERPFHYEGLYGMGGPANTNNNANSYNYKIQQNGEMLNGNGGISVISRKRSFQYNNNNNNSEKSDLFAEWQNERELESLLAKRSLYQSQNVGNSSTTTTDLDEDKLFCMIMMKKMAKMPEATKERAKAKILDILVQFQYGEIL